MARMMILAALLLAACTGYSNAASLNAAAKTDASANPFSFVTIGDWGCMGIGGYHANDELVVSKQFASAAADLNAQFVLNTGDNFYYCGVVNGTDPQFKETFENVFNQDSMMVPWYGCLGNHDYGYPGSAEAEMNYVSTTPSGMNRWVMPDRYYYKRLTFPGQVNISLVVVDASPCQSDYVNNDPANWDPCGSVIPGCPGCTFHQNVAAQSCAQQKVWLQSVVQQIPAGDWKIAMSHAPFEELDVADLTSVLQSAGMDFYINGHVHMLSQYQIDGAGSFVTSGAGCMVRVAQDVNNLKNAAEKEAALRRARMDTRRDLRAKLGRSSCVNTQSGHSCTPVWEQVVAGYTTHTFSADFSTLTTTYFDAYGNNLHSFDTSKGSNLKAAKN